MDCPCPKPANSGWSVFSRTAKAVLGIPDYEAYVAHVAERHAGAVAMSREAFFAAKQDARFGSTGMRCC